MLCVPSPGYKYLSFYGLGKGDKGYPVHLNFKYLLSTYT